MQIKIRIEVIHEGQSHEVLMEMDREPCEADRAAAWVPQAVGVVIAEEMRKFGFLLRAAIERAVDDQGTVAGGRALRPSTLR